jgi:hypothetical protein
MSETRGDRKENGPRETGKILEAVAWGALFIWWGLSFVQHFLPNGLDAAGTGVILLSVNAARKIKGVPVNGFSLTFGILTLLWGVLDMGNSVLHLAYRPPILAILLIALGVIVVVGAARRILRDGHGHSGQSAPQAS